MSVTTGPSLLPLRMTVIAEINLRKTPASFSNVFFMKYLVTEHFCEPHLSCFLTLCKFIVVLFVFEEEESDEELSEGVVFLILIVLRLISNV